MDDVGVESVLQEMGISLPAVREDGLVDEEVEGNGREEEDDDKSVSIFSRTSHFISVGVARDTLPANTNEVESSKNTTSKPQLESGNQSDIGSYFAEGFSTNHSTVVDTTVPENGTEAGKCLAEHPVGDTEWENFRTGFEQQLEHSDKRVVDEESTMKSHLEAISELMSSGLLVSQAGVQTERDVCPGETGKLETVGSEGASAWEPQKTGMSNKLHQKPSQGPLSANLLADINMSELDKALKLVSAAEPSKTPGDISTEGHHRPPPRTAWEETEGTNSSDLMSQLTAISNELVQTGKSQEEHRSYKPVQTNSLTETGQQTSLLETGKRVDGDEKKTVYLDLRQPPSQAAETLRHSQSISESEESDDALLWAQKRREMKTSSLMPLQHNLHHTEKMGETSGSSSNNPSSGTSQIQPSPKKSLSLYEPVPGSLREPEEGVELQWKTAESKRKKKKHKKTAERAGKGDCVLEPSNGNALLASRGSSDKPIVVGVSAPIDVQTRTVKEAEEEEERLLCNIVDSCESSPSTDSLLQSSTGSSNLSYPITNTVTLDITKTERHHTTDSITLSEFSSFSEGEALPDTPLSTTEQTVIDPAVSISSRNDEEKKNDGSKKAKRKRKNGGAKENQASQVANVQASMDSSPELGRAEFGTTKSREDGGEVKKNEKKRSERGASSKSKKKKKGDSKKRKKPALRIRCDSLTTSSDEDRGLDSPQLNRVDEMVETSPEKKEESEERLRQWLEYRIMAKKPPATFETPATEPLYHKDVSFSPVLTHTYPSVSTDALLILPLSETHGLFSLPSSHSHISPEAHLYLHFLLLSSLSSSAVHSYLSPRVMVGKGVGGRSPSPSHTSLKHLFRITILHQTTLDGQLSILIGISLPQGRKRSMSCPSAAHHGPRKRMGKSQGTVLSPLVVPRNPLVAELEDILCRQKMSDLLGNVLFGSEKGGNEELIVVPNQILNELKPLLDMSAQAFFSVHPDTEPLNTPTSFYWRSLYQPSCLPSSEALCSPEVIQSTVCVLPSRSLSSPPVVFSALYGAYDSGMSIAGVRLIYGEPCSPLDLPSPTSADDTITDSSVCLALCLRGPDAVSRCMDLVGPEDYRLACVTDPQSLMARFGSPAIQPAVCVRTPFRANAALARWFGGRACLCTGTVLGMNDSRTRSERRKRQRVRFSESEFESEDNLVPPTPDVSFPPLVANRPLLTILPYKELLLVISPLLPPLCYGPILSTCSRLGFDVSGMKRMRLNSKRAAILDIPESFLSHFIPSSTPPSPNFASFSGQHPLEVKPSIEIPPLPSLLLILSRENALVFGNTLRNTIVSDLKILLTCNPELQNSLPLDQPVQALLHTVPHSTEKVKVLGSFSSAPITSVSSLPQLAPGWERDEDKYGEEIAFLAMTQASGLSQSVELLHSLFQLRTDEETGPRGTEENVDVQEPDLGAFEILGIKLIPQLSRFHAKQLCPLQSSDHSYQEAIELLSGSQALVLILRGIACNRRLSQFLMPMYPPHGVLSHSSISNLSLLFSDSLSQAFHFTTLFFTDKELFCDPGSWLLLSAVPSSWARADVLSDLQSPPSTLHSMVVVRGGEWRLLVKVVDRLHRAGFEVCGITMRRRKNDENSTSDGSTSIDGCSEVAVCVSRQNAVWYLNHLLKPYTASSNNKNKLHCPSMFSDAVALIKQWFPRGLCSGIETSYYGIISFAADDFSGVTSAFHPSALPSSPITETTCLILPHSQLTPSPSHPTPYYLQLLELVALAKFNVTGVQLTHLSQNSISALEALGTETKNLISGPCLVVVLQRDNAASCFKYILHSTADRHSVRGVGMAGVDVEELLNGAVVPDSARAAAAVITALVKEE